MEPSLWRARAGSRRLQLTAGLLACVAVSLLGACTRAEQDRVVATVNGQAITVADLLGELRRSRGPSILVEMIDTQLIVGEAARRGLSVGEDEMRLRRDRAISEVGSEADFEQRLKATGTTREQLMERLRVDLLLDKIARAEMPIHEQEIEDFYRERQEEFRLGERVRGRMMLLGSREDAEALYQALQQPDASFAGLARQLSIDPGTKDRGGDMGYFEREDYAKEISDVAFSLEVGQMSQVFKAPDGYCILKVEGRKPPGFRPLAEVAPEIRARVAAVKLPAARRQWVVAARQAAAISINDKELRDAALEMMESAPPPGPVSLAPMLGA
jgi:foldase protein PrsA